MVCHMIGLILSFLHILSGMWYMCACIYVYAFAGTSHMHMGWSEGPCNVDPYIFTF